MENLGFFLTLLLFDRSYHCSLLAQKQKANSAQGMNYTLLSVTKSSLGPHNGLIFLSKIRQYLKNFLHKVFFMVPFTPATS